MITQVEIVVVIVTVAALLYDAVLFFRKGEQGTISFRTAMWSQRYPILPFLVGLLVGHLFWPNRGYCP